MKTTFEEPHDEHSVSLEQLCLSLSLEELWLIESYLKGNPRIFEPIQPFILRLAHGILTGQPQTIQVDEHLLWWLRAYIPVSAKMGAATGSELLKKIFTQLLKIYPQKNYLTLWEEINEFLGIKPKGSSSENGAKNRASDEARDGTAEGADSDGARSRPTETS